MVNRILIISVFTVFAGTATAEVGAIEKPRMRLFGQYERPEQLCYKTIVSGSRFYSFPDLTSDQYRKAHWLLEDLKRDHPRSSPQKVIQKLIEIFGPEVEHENFSLWVSAVTGNGGDPRALAKVVEQDPKWFKRSVKRLLRLRMLGRKRVLKHFDALPGWSHSIYDARMPWIFHFRYSTLITSLKALSLAGDPFAFKPYSQLTEKPRRLIIPDSNQVDFDASNETLSLARIREALSVNPEEGVHLAIVPQLGVESGAYFLLEKDHFNGTVLLLDRRLTEQEQKLYSQLVEMFKQRRIEYAKQVLEWRVHRAEANTNSNASVRAALSNDILGDDRILAQIALASTLPEYEGVELNFLTRDAMMFDTFRWLQSKFPILVARTEEARGTVPGKYGSLYKQSLVEFEGPGGERIRFRMTFRDYYSEREWHRYKQNEFNASGLQVEGAHR